MSDAKPKRRLVIVDTESSGLTERDICVEIAWHDLGTDEHHTFIPAHPVEWVLSNAHPDALALNGYADRIAHAVQDDGTEVRRLHHVLRGQVLAGANVRFDARLLGNVFVRAGLAPEPWFYRLAELGPYCCGVLGLHPAGPPSLAACCELLGVKPGDHTAAEDVRATVEAFRALMAKAGVA